MKLKQSWYVGSFSAVMKRYMDYVLRILSLINISCKATFMQYLMHNRLYQMDCACTFFI